MPTSQSKRRQPTGPAAGRQPSEPRTNLDPGAYIGRKPERTVTTEPEATTTKSAETSPVPEPNGHRGPTAADGESVRRPAEHR